MHPGEAAMSVVLIGIDDTDNEHSPGTGSLARRLSQECGNRVLGVTRHQFLVHPAIPYTSHNSGACVALEFTGDISDLGFALEFVANCAADGSDPGVCIARMDEVSKAVIGFARKATEQVVEMSEAFETARSESMLLCGLGGTCLGVIGALGSVGLRSEGMSGRFIDLPGLRELDDCVTLEAYDRIGVIVEHTGQREPCSDDRYLTGGWVRPRLVGGRAVLPVEWRKQENAWICVDRKTNKAEKSV
ncbi:MAG: hypothetical protein KAR47_17905 [Planctomycetes bacterium]|nr:hypothetical protein [Planctomycetota bacterium]